MVEHLNCYRLLKRVTHHDLRGARGLLGETDNRTSPVIIHRRILGAAVCRSDTAPPAKSGRIQAPSGRRKDGRALGKALEV